MELPVATPVDAAVTTASVGFAPYCSHFKKLLKRRAWCCLFSVRLFSSRNPAGRGETGERVLSQRTLHNTGECHGHERKETQLQIRDAPASCGAAARPDDRLARAFPFTRRPRTSFTTPHTRRNLFGLKEFGNIYTRIMNPTTGVFEERLAALEGGAGALATASGQAAQFLTVATIVPGRRQNRVDKFPLRGHVQPVQGDVSAARDQREVREGGHSGGFCEAHRQRRRRRSTSKPSETRGCNIADIEGIAKVAHAHGIPLIVDNTFGAAGYLCRPIDFGADIVVHSATKWIGGHGTTIGGRDRRFGASSTGRTAISRSSRSRVPGYHGLKFWDAFGAGSPLGNIAFIIRARVESLRDLGPCQSPFNSFLLTQGLETLSLRIDRHCENAIALAKWLKRDPRVEWVLYPGLEDHPYHAPCEKVPAPGPFREHRRVRPEGRAERGKGTYRQCRPIKPRGKRR